MNFSEKIIKEKLLEVIMTFPKVSIIIATFNSEKVLPRTLDAIKRQSYPSNKIEVLLIDGGSTDNTLSLADAYNCIVYPNPKTDPVNAKLIGFRKASGKYVITIDHDEVMENKDSILRKVISLEENSSCKVALCSGYKRPNKYPLLNQYISEFGDPFSLFIYRFSKGYNFFEKVLRKKFDIINENNDYLVISFNNIKTPVIFELCCMGTMVDREYFNTIPGAFEEGDVFTHLFYYMIESGSKNVIIVKDDPLTHYSVDSLKAYFPKIKWRIINNVHFEQQGNNGFSGREKLQPSIKYKKYLFPLYSYTLFFSLFDSVYYSITRKNGIFLLHWILCIYVASQIIYQYFLKIIHKRPQFTSYDGKKVIM